MTKFAPWIVLGFILAQAAAQAAGPASPRPAAASAPASGPDVYRTETRMLPPMVVEGDEEEFLEGIGIVVSLVRAGDGKKPISVNGAKEPTPRLLG